MAEATATMTREGNAVLAVRDGSAAIAHGTRRVWRAGLGVLAITAERIRQTFAALEQRGEQLEPVVSAPLKRAGEAATRVADRAGNSMKTVGNVVSSATNSVADVGRRMRTADLSEEVQRLVDESLAAALQQLDIPTKGDLQALADRVEELASKAKRKPESH
jgi:poly(hydroxyalkanoate) granule-associated protein